MNTDIRVAVSFRGHRKRKRLQMLCGPEGVLCLLDLWIGVAQSNPTGMLRAWDEHDLAFEAGWTGDPKLFEQALVECRFIEHLEGEPGYRLHDWEKHQGYAIHAEARTEKARKAAEARWGKTEKQKDNARSMQVALPQASSSNAPSPNPNPTPIVLKDRDDKAESSTKSTTKPAPKTKRFIQPTLEEVAAYCQERKNDVNPQRWIDHYTSNGWRVGKNPMRDWKAAVRTWEKDGKDKNHGDTMQPRNVTEALVVQGDQIARALNEFDRQKHAGPDDREASGLLMEHPVSRGEIHQRAVGQAIDRIPRGPG